MNNDASHQGLMKLKASTPSMASPTTAVCDAAGNSGDERCH